MNECDPAEVERQSKLGGPDLSEERPAAIVRPTEKPKELPANPTAKDVLSTFEGRVIDGRGLLIAEMNGLLATHGLRERVLRFDQTDRGARPVLNTDTFPPELGTQPWDAKHSRDNWSSRARLGTPQDAERAARPSDSPLEKFKLIWEA